MSASRIADLVAPRRAWRTASRRGDQALADAALAADHADDVADDGMGIAGLVKILRLAAVVAAATAVYWVQLSSASLPQPEQPCCSYSSLIVLVPFY